MIFLEGTTMAKVKMPHAGHDKHLCYLNSLGFQISNPEDYKNTCEKRQISLQGVRASGGCRKKSLQTCEAVKGRRSQTGEGKEQTLGG